MKKRPWSRLGLAVGTVLGATAAFGVVTAFSGERSEWPRSPAPDGTVAIPALSSSPLPAGAELVKVCMSPGEAPKSYAVLSEVCWTGAQHCTVFVAVPSSDHVRIREFDVMSPPTVSQTDEICATPIRPVAGVFGHP